MIIIHSCLAIKQYHAIFKYTIEYYTEKLALLIVLPTDNQRPHPLRYRLCMELKVVCHRVPQSPILDLLMMFIQAFSVLSWSDQTEGRYK